MRCPFINPDSREQCDLAARHGGSHRRNGLVWDTEGFSGSYEPPNDPINRPKHYTSHPSGIECIQVTRHMNFNRGNAIKYIWRAGEKGPAIEDLKKAAWYIADEIKRLEGDAEAE